MDRRGISPLLATIILVGIVIAGAAVVFLWSMRLTREIEEKEGDISQLALSCSQVRLDVTGTADGLVTVENIGSVIDGVIIVARGDGTSGNTIYDDPPEPGSSRSYPYEGIPGVPVVERVSVIPALGKGIYRPCSEQKVDVEL